MLLASAVVFFSWPLYPSSVALEGRIHVEKRSPPVLQSGGKRILLSSEDTMISETLRDPRVSGKELKLIGKYGAGGTFQVSELYVVHPDGLYRIIYYCKVCHITAFSPGNCICCQQPTELEEVPLTDPRIYHENVEK
jgi:hypothetical protein